MRGYNRRNMIKVGIVGAVAGITPAGITLAHEENGGSNECGVFVADTPGQSCDGWYFCSKRPVSTGGQMEAVFEVDGTRFGAADLCKFDEFLVRYNDDATVEITDTRRTWELESGLGYTLASYATTECENQGAQSAHKRYASAVEVFYAPDGGTFDFDGHGGSLDGQFDSFSGGSINNHLGQCNEGAEVNDSGFGWCRKC